MPRPASFTTNGRRNISAAIPFSEPSPLDNVGSQQEPFSHSESPGASPLPRVESTARVSSPLAHPDPRSPSGPSTPLVSQHNEESATPPTVHSDTRDLIEVVDHQKLDAAGRGALIQIVHSHFDGPYIKWSKVADGTLKNWWKMFEMQCRWDEGRFSLECVYKAFNTEGSNHLRRIFDKARAKKCKPVWIKERFWTEMLAEWAKPEFQHKSEVNKKNRAVAKEKGIPPYRGGSVPTTVHKKRLKSDKGENAPEPSPKETFERCYRKKDGTLPEPAQQIIENYDLLFEQATQEAQDNETPHSIDENQIWIQATGGVKKGRRILGMGSEAESMLKKTRYVRGSTSVGTCGPSEASDFMRDDVMAEISSLKTQLSQGLASLAEKMTNVQQNQEEIRRDVTNLGDTVQLNQEQVSQDMANMEQFVDKSVEAVQTETRLNNNALQKSIEETILTAVSKVFANQQS